MATYHKKLTASGVISNCACDFRGFLIGTDGSNDPTVTFYDNTAASGNEVIPTATYDASALGLNGVTLPDRGIRCETGLYCEISISAGAVEVTVFWS